MNTNQNQNISPKKRRIRYDLRTKEQIACDIIKEKISYKQANEQHGINESTMRNWVKEYKERGTLLRNVKNKRRKRNGGGGKKPKIPLSIEFDINKWLEDKQEQCLIIEKKDILTLAKRFSNNNDITYEWVRSFMRRWKWTNRRTTTIEKKTPNEINEKLISWNKLIENEYEQMRYAKRVWNLDETGVFLDSNKNYSVAKKGLKQVKTLTTGATKDRITFIPIVNTEGEFINYLGIIKGDESKTKTGTDRVRLNKKNLPCKVYKQPNAFMNEKVFKALIEDIFPRVSGINYIFIDQCTAHLKYDAIKMLEDKGWTVRFIPPGLTGYVQTLDYGIFREMKRNVSEKWRKWIWENATRDYIPKKPKYDKALKWCIDSCNEIDKKLIQNSWYSVGFKFVVNRERESNINKLVLNIDEGGLDHNKVDEFTKNSKGKCVKTENNMDEIEKLMKIIELN